MSRHTDPMLNALDKFLQVFVGDRETRPDPGVADKSQAFRDFDSMIEIEESMSNCYHEIDEGIDEKLRAQPGKVFSRHAGWNFNGKVWFENDAFHEEVWVYGTPRQTLSAPSLRELMTVVNNEYGDD